MLIITHIRYTNPVIIIILLAYIITAFQKTVCNNNDSDNTISKYNSNSVINTINRVINTITFIINDYQYHTIKVGYKAKGMLRENVLFMSQRNEKVNCIFL